MMKQKKSKSGGSKKWRQNMHNDEHHKYEKQRYRTAMNKARHIKKAAVLKAAADAQKKARHGKADSSGSIIHG